MINSIIKQKAIVQLVLKQLELAAIQYYNYMDYKGSTAEIEEMILWQMDDIKQSGR